jgi:hypothetical protein
MTISASTTPSGLTFMIDSLGKDCTPQQQLREFTKNGIDAILRTFRNKNSVHSGEVIIDVDTSYGVNKLCIIDNGCGMDADELTHHIKSIATTSGNQSYTENFGMGARIAGGIANPFGVVYMSWKNGIGHMVIFWKDPNSNIYGLSEDLDPTSKTPWLLPLDASEKPSLIDQHGTKIVLLGMCETDDTTIANDLPAGVERKKWVPYYLNNRFFKFPDNITVRCFPNQSWQSRVIKGMEHHLTTNSAASGQMTLTDVTLHWWILNLDPTGKKNARGDACIENSHVAILYQDELYGLKTSNVGKAILNQFGIVHATKRIVLYAEPIGAAYMADLTRSTIKCGGKDLPWEEWGTIFRDNMPKEIIDIENESASTATLIDIEDIKRLLSSVMGYFKLSAPSRKKDNTNEISDINPSEEGSGTEGTDGYISGSGGFGGNGGGGAGSSGAARGGTGKRPPYKRALNTLEEKDSLHPKILWMDDPDSDLIGFAAKYYATQNTIMCNRKFPVFIDMHQKLVAEKSLTGGMVTICRDSIEKWYSLALTEAVLGILSIESQLKWSIDTRQAALTPNALTAICVQKYSQIANIKREIGSKLGAT